MRKFINLVALAALLFMPSLAWSQSADCTEYTSVPYSTGFEGLSTGSLPDCWLKVQTSAGYDGVVFPCAYNYSGNARNGSVYFEMETHSGQNEIVAMPLMENISTLKLTFWASAQSSYLPTMFEVGVLEADSTFTPVDTITFTTSYSWSSGYNQYTVYFSNYTGNGERIAMRATGNGSGQYTLMMDDFTVTDALVPEVSLPATAVTNINTDLTLTATLQGPTDGITYSWTSLMETAGNATLSYVDNVATINYSVAGTDTVTLTVTNANGSASASIAVRALDLSPVTSFPYTTGFETEQDANWNFVNGSNGWFIGSAVNNGGSNAMYISNDNGTTNAYSNGNASDSYAYRYFQFDAGEYTYSFDWRSVGENNWDYLYFYLAPTSSDFSGTSVSTSGWTDLAGRMQSQSSWQTKTGTFTITETGLYPVVFYWRNDGSGGSNPPAAIDNIAITALTCPAVTNIVLDSAEQDALTFHWTSLGTETSWEVTVGDNIVEVNSTSYTATGLNSNTAYTVSVRAVCGADDTSFATTASFRTACGPMSVPFFEDFDSYANGDFPPCWQRLRAYGTDPSVNQQYHHSGTQAMYLLSYMDTNLFCTPSTVPLNGNEIQVRYQAYMSRGDQNTWLKAGVMTDPTDVSTFIMLDSVGYHSFNYEFEEREFNTATLNASASYYVAWMFYGNYNQWSYYYSTGAIDDISITQLSDCVRPTMAQIGTVGARQAEVSWASASSANSYTVYYYTANDPTNANVLSESVSDTTVTLTGLQPETQYYVWVATNCGGSESDLRPAGNFTTLISCPAVTGLTVDTTTTDGATISWHPGDVETEWLVAIDSNDYDVVNDTTYSFYGLDAMTGHTVYVRAFCGDDDTSAVSSINFATACADATCNITAHVTDSYDDSWNGCLINIVQAGITVTSIECPSGQSGSDFSYEVCSSAPVTLTFTRGSYPNELGGYVTDGSGATVFTIENMGNHYTGDVLTTINNPCPECIMPMGIALDSASLSATEATIYWERQDGQSAWFVKLDTNDIVSVSDTFYTFLNLDARTAYTAYVATDCNGDTSSFASINFATDCATGSCDISVTATSSYPYSAYCPTVHVWQNGSEVASVNASTQTVNVCSGVPVNIIYQTPQYSWGDIPSVIILDGGDDEVFNANTESYSTGDTLVFLANACPSCLKPTGVRVTSIDSTEISFAWNENDSVNSYLISLNGSAETEGFNGNEFYSNLTPNTTYTFSVRAVCAPGDTSNAKVITVKTACGEMALPLIESFEGDAEGTVPTCWNVVNGNPEVDAYATNAHSGNHSLTMGSGSNMIATSRVPLDGDSIYVGFWADFASGILEAGVMTNPLYDTTFIPLMTINSTNGYELFEFTTSTLPHDSSYFVAFRYNAPYNYVYLDDINIRLFEGCMYPTNLVATPAASRVDLSWNYNGTTTDFAIEYRILGDTAWSLPDDINDTAYTLTGLSSSSSYEVRVGTICGNDTLWVITTFQTNCLPQALPYSEDFDAYADDVMPPCWIWSSAYSTHWDGGVFLKAYHGGGSEYVVLPELNGNIAKLKIEFDTKVGSPSENDGILIGVTDAAGTLLAWVDTIQDPLFSRNNHVRKTIYFTNYLLPGGAARVAFAQYRNWNEWALIDNINIEELPSCYPVDNLVGSNLIDPEATTFTWHPMGFENQWQVYVDTVTVDIDSLDNLPDSLFITVTDTSYTIPIGMIQGGGIYNFFVRAICSATEHSNWVKNEFGAGTVIMNNSNVADTIEGCGFVIYDNGGPIPGYLPNSNSALVIRTENVGSQLQIFGGKFGWGSSPATLTVYDGEGTNGTVLYTYNTVNGRDTLLNTVLATSTTGSMTITFSVSGNMCHTGYELYVRCTEGALCPRPTELQAEMTSASTADVTWNGSASNYHFYYRLAGSATWVRQNVAVNSISLTGLMPDTVYDMYVVALCSASDSSSASVVRQLHTTYIIPVVPCDAPSSLVASNITSNSVLLNWTAGGTETTWAINYNGSTILVNTNPYLLTGLTPSTNYTIKVQAVCDTNSSSEWSNEILVTTLAGTPDVTYYTVTVNSNNPNWGSVSGGGTYAENTQAPLNAIPNDGYHFVSWSNGVTAASISITVTSDTSLTATFAENNPEVTYYTITLTANNPNWGTVTGAGTYEEGRSVEIKAISNSGYRFVKWSDNNTDSVRTITVNNDISLIATFERSVGIDDVNASNIALYPNPASSLVTLSGIEGQALVTVVDMNGREVLHCSASQSITIDISTLTSGAYFVRIVGEQVNAIRKLIVR